MANETVLVVDDDKEIVKILRGYLEQAGFTVLMAYDGTSALHVLRRERPDLLLLDLMLPDKDGWALTRLIRADAMLQTTPILMITARVDDADKIGGRHQHLKAAHFSVFAHVGERHAADLEEAADGQIGDFIASGRFFNFRGEDHIAGLEGKADLLGVAILAANSG